MALGSSFSRGVNRVKSYLTSKPKTNPSYNISAPSRPVGVSVKTTPAQKLASVRVTDFRGKPTVATTTTSRGTYTTTTTPGGSITTRGENAWNTPIGTIQQRYAAGGSGTYTEYTPAQQTAQYQIGSMTLPSAAQAKQSYQQFKQSSVTNTQVAGAMLMQGRLFYQADRFQAERGIGRLQEGISFAESGATILKSGFKMGYTKNEFTGINKNFFNPQSVTFKDPFSKLVKSYPSTPATQLGKAEVIGGGLYLLGGGIYSSIKSFGFKEGLVNVGTNFFSVIQPKPGIYMPQIEPMTGVKVRQTPLTRSTKLEYVYAEKVGLPGAELGTIKARGTQYITNQKGFKFETVTFPVAQVKAGGDVFIGQGLQGVFSRTSQYGVGTIIGDKNYQFFGINKAVPKFGVQAVQLEQGFSFRNIPKSQLPKTEFSLTTSGEIATKPGQFRFTSTRPEGIRIGETGIVGLRPSVTGRSKLIQTPYKFTVVEAPYAPKRFEYQIGGMRPQILKRVNFQSTAPATLTSFAPTMKTISLFPSVSASSFILPPLTSVQPKTITSITPMTKLTTTWQVNKAKPLVLTSFTPFPKIAGATSFGSSSALATSLTSGTLTIPMTETTSSFTPDFGKFTGTEFVPFPFIPKFFKGFETGISSRKIKGKKRRSKYTPSYEALVFNIKGKQPKKITGLEIRPITKGFKWSYNKIGF